MKNKLCEMRGHEFPFLGQGAGLVKGVRSGTTVVWDFKEEFADAVGVLMETIDE